MGRSMTVKHAGVLVALLVFGVLTFALWYQQRYPRQIVSTGSIRVESKSRPGNPMALETRRVRVATQEFSEVRMPNGTWIDCAGDCRKAVLDIGPDIWDYQGRNQGR